MAPLPPVSRRRFLVIHNPTAGWRHKALLRRTLARLDSLGCDIVLRPTGRAGDARAFAEEAAHASAEDGAPRFDAVVAAGGDGTINEVVNGMIGSDLPLGIIPLGTANVLAGEIGLRRRTRGIVQALVHGPACAIRPGELRGASGGRAFSMMLSAGFDATVVAHVRLGWKRLVGKLAYVMQGIAEWLRYRPVGLLVTVDGAPHSAAVAIVSKGRLYGGSFVVAPDADLAADRLEVTLFRRPGRWNLLRYAWGVASGRLSHFRDVERIGARSVEIDGPSNQAIQADGDAIALLPVSVGLASARLLLIRPEA